MSSEDSLTLILTLTLTLTLTILLANRWSVQLNINVCTCQYTTQSHVSKLQIKFVLVAGLVTQDSGWERGILSDANILHFLL